MSSVIFKSSFVHPNLKMTRQKNASHVAYISTCTGVDKSITKRDLENGFGIDYIHKSSIYNDLLDEKGYLKYINERPRSHGLFGESGIEDLKSVQEEIKKHSSFIWRNIISLREEDALRMDGTMNVKLGFKMKIMIILMRWGALIWASKNESSLWTTFIQK